MKPLDQLKDAIREKLPDLDLVIGWGPGFDALHVTPLFMRKPEDVDKFVFGPLCVNNLATYLTGLKGRKIGLVVKGCDSRSVVELLQEGLLKREDLTIFGLPCAGVADLTKVRRALDAQGVDMGRVSKVEATDGQITVEIDGKPYALKLADVAADKCGVCRYHNAIIIDHFFGEPLPPSVEHDAYADVAAFESKSLEERMGHWQEEMKRCIRCYACRNACPMCVCRDHCIAQSRDPHWLSEQDTTRDKFMFQMIHAMHLAGRCTECGECQRACPVDIPILALKRKLNREIRDLFAYEAGVDPQARPPLMAFKVEEQNINERGW